METLETSTLIRRPLSTVWAAHADLSLLSRVYPLPVEILDAPATLDTGAQFTLRLAGLPFADWRVEIVRWEPEQRFIDRQVSGPLRFWEHTHQFSAPLPEATLVVDRIVFEWNPPFDGLLVKPVLEAVFAWRGSQMQQALGGA